VGTLIVLLVPHFGEAQRLGFSRNHLIFILSCLFVSFISFVYSHLATLDFYRQCAEFRARIRLRSAELPKLREHVLSSWKAAYRAIQIGHALISLAGLAAIYGFISFVQ
jgi:hypothetical protein